MTQEIGYTKDKIKKKDKDKLSIIDASCGAGTFLYSAVDRLIDSFGGGTKEQAKHIAGLIDKNIFGLDIAEFPLYLAEMNILMRMLPLIVNDSYENPKMFLSIKPAMCLACSFVPPPKLSMSLSTAL